MADERLVAGLGAWLRDSDVIVVPKGKIRHFGRFADMVFSQGEYGELPVQATAIGVNRPGKL